MAKEATHRQPLDLSPAPPRAHAAEGGTGSGAGGASVLGVRVEAVTNPELVERTLEWIGTPRGRYVCFCNVHMVMEAFDDPALRAAINAADAVMADGMPVVWALRALGVPGAQRAYGPDFTELFCARAERVGASVAFVGSTDEVLVRLRRRLEKRYPRLRIAGLWSPPFRPMSDEETGALLEEVRDSGADVAFIGLGCPKQERWMAKHAASLGMPLFGVGAAFDFLAGTKKQAPRWMQRGGLEWLFRGLNEPRRLLKRYAYQNPRFLWYFGRQLLGRERSRIRAR